MTPQDIKMVQDSFAKVAPLGPKVAELFYGQLFTLDPSLRPLFKGDMKEQGIKLISALAVVVRSLGRLEAVLPTVQALGRRHAGYGVVAAHYDTVATALLWTLEQGLGAEAFTPQLKAAWTECYGLVAEAMIAASRTA